MNYECTILGESIGAASAKYIHSCYSPLFSHFPRQRLNGSSGYLVPFGSFTQHCTIIYFLLFAMGTESMTA